MANFAVMINRKHTPWIPFSTLLFLNLLVSCHEQTSYDPRLTAADSALVANPDSALSQLTSVDAGHLTSPADRAYHALLLSQARYRCYVKATSDSDISLALDYYSHHRDEREKLTRCYIYKGAVLEELGRNEEAIRYYLQGKSTAAPDDYFNQGYARLRLGKIYQDNLVADSSDVALLKGALHYFMLVPDSFYVLTSTNALGCSYIKHNQDSALHYLSQAHELARQLHHTRIELMSSRTMAEVKMFNDDARDVQAAKETALSLLSSSDLEAEERDHVLMIAAYTLGRQHKTDSARYFLNQVSTRGLSPGRQVFYHNCLAQIALNEGNIRKYEYHFNRADCLDDSIVGNDLQRQLRDVEERYDNEALKYKNLRYKSTLRELILGALLLVSTLALALLAAVRKSSRRKQQLKESEDALERLHSDTEQLRLQLASNQAMSEKLKQAISGQVETFTRLVEIHYKVFAHNPQQFADLLKRSYSAKQPKQTFWNSMRSYADNTYGNIITVTHEKFPFPSKDR